MGNGIENILQFKKPREPQLNAIHEDVAAVAGQ